MDTCVKLPPTNFRNLFHPCFPLLSCRCNMATFESRLGRYIRDISRSPSLFSDSFQRNVSVNHRCSLSSNVRGIPLNEPLPDFPIKPSSLSGVRNSSYETQVTKLENGLRVASENSFGQFSTVGGKRNFQYCGKPWRDLFFISC